MQIPLVGPPCDVALAVGALRSLAWGGHCPWASCSETGPLQPVSGVLSCLAACPQSGVLIVFKYVKKFVLFLLEAIVNFIKYCRFLAVS